MARRRRNVETFGLSFLDCICCGFGAVILLYTMISSQSAASRNNRTQDLTAEATRLDADVVTGRQDLVALRKTLQETEAETVSAAARARQIAAEMESQHQNASTYDATSVAQRERIEKLKADVRALEESTKRLEAGTRDIGEPGQQVRAFRGTGERSYITGLRLRGSRILVLVDTSASMLHEDLVSVIRLRNSDDAKKRNAAKWRRAVETVDWMLTQLPPGAQFQVYGFNTKAEPVRAASAGKWQSGGDPVALEGTIDALRQVIPRDGTSLVNAFAATRTLSPAPDQIVLITDGLPTQGKTAGLRKYIDAAGRARLFDDSIAEIPDKTPVDIVLLPMKGDLPAAHRFWQLARLTNGILLMPSKDWP